MHAGPPLKRLAACALALWMVLPTDANAAPWRDYATLPSGDVVMVRTQGLALKPAGSRLEVDFPVRVRFAAPVESPVGPVVLADATVRVLCKGRTVTASRLAARTPEGKAFATKDRPAAVKALRPSLDQTLLAPAFIDKVCQA